MERAVLPSRWAAELIAAVVCVVLVVDRNAVIHTNTGARWFSALAVVGALGALALCALARFAPAGAAPLALVAAFGGLSRSDDARLAVAGLALAALLPFVALLLAAPERRRLVVLVAIATVVVVATRLWFRDPFLELHCEPFCGSNPFMISHRPAVVRVSEWLLVASSAFSLIWCAATRSASNAARVAAWVAAAIWTMHLAVRPRPIPDSGLDLTFDLLLFGVIMAFATFGAWGAWSTWRAGVQMQRFGRTIAASGDVDGIEAMLKRATRDQTLRVELAGRHPGDLPDATSSTAVVRNGKQIAVITHRPGHRERVANAVTSTVALALETQLLLRDTRQLVVDVDASRARVARSTDAARRTLERNLHDGAQQHLLVTGMALANAADHATGPDRERYRHAADELSVALGELRRLGRGDAATIAELGLADAVSALAAREPTPMSMRVESCSTPKHDCWPIREATSAYRLLVSMVREASQGECGGIHFTARCLGPGEGHQVVVGHDGPTGDDHALDRDRIVAVGGRVEFSATGPRVTEAWLP